MELTFTDEVLPLLESFDDTREAVAESLGDKTPELAEYFLKQKYNIRRIAGIVHLISAESDVVNGVLLPQISRDEFLYAERIVEFFERCAAKTLEMMSLKRVEKMTDKQLLREFNNRFHPSNISELARLIKKTPQYLSKVFLNQDTTKVEAEEQAKKKDCQEIKQFITTNCASLQTIDGLPSDEEIEAMMSVTGGSITKTKETLQKMSEYKEISKGKGMIYSLLFSQFVC